LTWVSVLATFLDFQSLSSADQHGIVRGLAVRGKGERYRSALVRRLGGRGDGRQQNKAHRYGKYGQVVRGGADHIFGDHHSQYGARSVDSAGDAQQDSSERKEKCDLSTKQAMALVIKSHEGGHDSAGANAKRQCWPQGKPTVLGQ
jgi:hypothetical protein